MGVSSDGVQRMLGENFEEIKNRWTRSYVTRYISRVFLFKSTFSFYQYSALQ